MREVGSNTADLFKTQRNLTTFSVLLFSSSLWVLNILYLRIAFCDQLASVQWWGGVTAMGSVYSTMWLYRKTQSSVDCYTTTQPLVVIWSSITVLWKVPEYYVQPYTPYCVLCTKYTIVHTINKLYSTARETPNKGRTSGDLWEVKDRLRIH